MLVVSLIGLASFWYQFTSNNDREHMALESRIWQFMFGFLAHYLIKCQETGRLDLVENAEKRGRILYWVGRRKFELWAC
jgi:hypothetical protein